MVDGFYKWQIVEKGRQVLYCKFESTIPQDQVDDLKLILSSMLSIIALSSIKYIYIYIKTVIVMELLYTLLLHFRIGLFTRNFFLWTSR